MIFTVISSAFADWQMIQRRRRPGRTVMMTVRMRMKRRMTPR